MSLRLIDPRDKFLLKRDVISTQAVLGHLRSVLRSFAMKEGHSQFYIGITRHVERRCDQHRVKNPWAQWMCPVFEEAVPHVLAGSFDALERDAIREFRRGIIHPETNKVLLSCRNGPSGSQPKTCLYVLVG